MFGICNEIVPLVAIVTSFGVPAMVIIVWAVLRYREKMHLLGHGFPPGLDFPGYPGRAPLFWGMLLTAVSAVGIVLALIDYEHEWANVGYLALTVGITLLVYWKITGPHRQRDVEFYERRCNDLRTPGGAGK